jgi:antitoxin HicB
MSRREIVTAHHYRYTALFEPVEDGGYVVTCPSLPGLVIEGDTLEEAREKAANAIRGYLETLSEDGLSMPPEIAEVLEIAIDER